MNLLGYSPNLVGFEGLLSQPTPVVPLVTVVTQVF